MSTLLQASLVAAVLGCAAMDLRATTIREVVELLFRHHGPELVQETAESLAGRLQGLTLRQGARFSKPPARLAHGLCR